ncbi:unnamed protein product [Effrenium voratum]|uniref:Uncharacterized protein n=1 Tax=Effrenium voratum TaxID=2562239 RepID=A0AA36N6D1_9DINO|nr:unnamed protein product [Effrenium voratum]
MSSNARAFSETPEVNAVVILQGILREFFDLDLASAFGHAFWEILQGSGQRAAWNEVEAVLNGKYEELMDACLLDKAMWEATETCALDQESLRNKVYKALKSGHQAAYDAAMSSPMDDVGRVELFLRTWIETMVGKAWQAVEQGNLLNEDSLVMLFQELLAPFGEEHPFSCVPAVLTQSIGRPPRDWEFLPEAVRQFFQNWNSGGNAGGNTGGYGGNASHAGAYGGRKRYAQPNGNGAVAMALPLVVDAFCTLEANSKVKAPMRHVLIRDLGKVAVALKQPPLEEPSALLVLVDGDPSASDFCARQMHTRLLKRLAARAKPSAALGGAILDLDAELRSQRPGMPGTSCCAALFVGRQLHVVVAGNCAGMLWGEGLAAAATATSSASEIGKDGVMRRSGKETPQQKRAKALLKLRAARPTEQIGGSVALPGGRRPGAQAVQSAGAGAVKAQNARSAGAGGEAALRAEDLLLEARQGHRFSDRISWGCEHSLLVLSSAGLFASFSPQDSELSA